MLPVPVAKRARTRDSLLSFWCLFAGEGEDGGGGGGGGGGASSNWENLSTAMPRATKPRPVRSQARKVRSEARWSRAVEPVFLRMGVRR